MRRRVAFLAFATIFALNSQLVACDLPSCACSSDVAQSCQGAWQTAATPNFQVCSLTSFAEAAHVARRCEHLRQELGQAWALLDDAQAWQPKCQVILHRSTRDYGAAVGPPYASTFGSSLVKPRTGKITVRRIDLRTDVDDYLTAALPHELCHILLADRFRKEAIPLWYDEGIALLADTDAKQRLHDRDLRDGISRQTHYTVAELLVAQQYPHYERMGVFYGQCAALTRYLRTQGSAEQLHIFAVRCGEVGVNLAVRECYGFTGAQDLEQKWLASVASGIMPATAQILPVTYSTSPPPRPAPAK